MLKTADKVPPDVLKSPKRRVFLVHGFNVDGDDAESSYLAFERWLSEEVRADVVRVYWPGDAAFGGDVKRGRKGFLSKILSGLSFVVQPITAEQAGQMLVEALSDAQKARRLAGDVRQQDIAIVAHSLGCRLTLEAVKTLVNDSGVALPLVVLMAPAVARYEVMADGNYRRALDREGLRQLVVLHSFEDSVLRGLFRPGSFPDRPIRGLNPFTRGALGRAGMPSDAKVRAIEGIWNHSDYWPDREVSRAVDGHLSGRRGESLDELQRVVSGRRLEGRRLEGRRIGSVSTIL